jgi:hypothetical protein
MRIGWSTRVSKAIASAPPITTTASGRWVCAPIPRRQRRRQETQGIDEVGRHRRAKLPVGILSVALMMDSTKGCP